MAAPLFAEVGPHPLGGAAWVTRVEVPNRRLPDLVEDSVRRWPDRPALNHYGVRWSYAKFWKEAGAFAAALREAGFRAGDRLALYLPNTPVFPIAYYGALRLGVTVVQVSPLYLGQDLTRLLLDSRPKGVVTLEILYPQLAAVATEAPVELVYVARTRDAYPIPRRWFVNAVLHRAGRSTRWPTDACVRPWSDAVRTSGEIPAIASDPATEVAVLQYTGGTTGRPKAAMLTHRNLVANALQCEARFRREGDHRDVVLVSVPLFHVYGMTVAMNYPLIDGAELVLQPRPDMAEALKLIARYRPTQFPGVPAFYSGILQQPKLDRYDIRSIQICVSGSAPLPREVADRFERVTGGNLVEGYGLSEASPVTHVNPPLGERRAGTIGLPLPNTEQRLLNIDNGELVVAPGVPGELCVRGPQVMLGYYHAEAETALVLHDGWLRTGDIATLDGDGYATIVDRLKDLVNVGGMKVYPREVEEVLFQHPSVAEAAAIGVPDPAHGEVIKAFVVLHAGKPATEAELIAFVRQRIAHYKAPRSIEFRTSLPRSGVQKVLRRELRHPPPAA
ncbi:MAG: long-chain fatty acid--CoA ligase [Thermoplasmata archaeon]|nr:long-chain fatty acid--CoA ligase [Thermoplasmata archaeon]